MSMLTVRMNEQAGIVVEEMNKPEPKGFEVRVNVVMSSLNFADLKVVSASKPGQLGIDLVGVVDQVGEHVTKVRVGDRVIAFPKTSGHAEYAIANEQLVYRIPATLSWEQAAASPIVVFLSYFLTKEIVPLSHEDSIIVHAASGGVGTTLIQLAKRTGLKTIIGTVGSLDKAEAAYRAGASHVCTYQSFKNDTWAITEGKGVSVIFDSIAGHVTEDSLHVLAHFGTLIQFGNASGQKSYVSNEDLHKSCRSIKGFSFGTMRAFKPDRVEKAASKVLDLLAEGTVKTEIDRVFSLTEAKNAYRYFQTRKHQGKILLKMNH